MSEEIDYAARVQRGITLLDQKWPAWATEIDLDRLDISSGESCMTAQYAGLQGDEQYFSAGRDLLGLDVDSYVSHGFDVGSAVGSAEAAAYAALNGLWKAAILERRSQAQDAPAEPEATA